MANLRRSYTSVEQLSLATQVGGHCPLCDAPLFYEKKSRMYKGYELAHIYPLNPTPEEFEILRGARQLTLDVNHPDNLIPLCTACHTKLDKPRTREEYEQLIILKENLLRKEAQRKLNAQYPLEHQLRKIVVRLHEVVLDQETNPELELDPKRLRDKFGPTLPAPVKQKIRHAVTDYYQYIRAAFRELEKEYPSSSEVIFSQVRTYYLKQKALGFAQATTFGNVVDWFRTTGGAETLESAEIMASFFVQNCEVFE